MKKPFAFALFEALGRLLGPRRLKSLFRWTIVEVLVRWPRYRRWTRSYLRRVLLYQEKTASDERVGALIRATADRYAETLVSISLLDQLRPRVKELVELDLLPVLEKLRKAGRGVILVTPHFGDLYLGFTALGETGIPIKALLLGAEVFRWAESGSIRYLPLGSSADDLLKALAANEVVIVFGDMEYFPSGRLADFFGAPIPPPDGAARLAIASGAPLLPMFVVSEGGKHHVRAHEPIFVEPGTTQEEIEERILRAMEAFIGPHPDQWMMFLDIWDLEASRERNLAQLRSWKPSRR